MCVTSFQEIVEYDTSYQEFVTAPPPSTLMRRMAYLGASSRIGEMLELRQTQIHRH